MGVKKVKTKKLANKKEQAWVKLIKQTSPKFAHNAISRGVDPEWTYQYWKDAQPDNRSEITITMDAKKMKKLHGTNENKQSKMMNDAAIAEAQKLLGKDYAVKLTSK